MSCSDNIINVSIHTYVHSYVLSESEIGTEKCLDTCQQMIIGKCQNKFIIHIRLAS